MRAIHWVRSRQESEELSFWLSIVAYNPKDRSLSNQMYLFYLLVFFSIWWFIVLVWFANTGGMLLSLLFPMAEMNGAVGIELVVLLIWFLTMLFMALLKSPVAFSEEDAYIVCQMPLSPRKLVLRWSFLPWVKSLIPFLIVAMALGFSLADVTLKAEGIADPSIFAYILDGLRAALVLIPIHLAGFALTWANGVWFMTHRRREAGWIFPILTLIGVGAPLTLGILASFDVALPGVLGTVGSLMPAVLLAGFGAGGLGRILLIGSLIALIVVILMNLSAARFSASQAAQETQTQVTNRELKRYGFSSQVHNRRVQQRLGMSQRAKWQPKWTGAAALIWKDILGIRREINISYFYRVMTFIAVGLGLVFIQSLGGRIIMILTWAMQAGKFLTSRLREDMAHWTISRQQPLDSTWWILADLSFSSVVILLTSLLGMVGGALLSGSSPLAEMLSLPGMILSIAGVSAIMIFRHSHIDLLMTGQVPGINEIGVLIAAAAAAVPMVVYSVLPGWAGVILGFLASLFIAEMVIAASRKAFQAID